MHYELTNHEWAAIKPMLPDKPRDIPSRKALDRAGPTSPIVVRHLVTSSRAEICFTSATMLTSIRRAEMALKSLVNLCVCGMLALAAASGSVLAQSATDAEARLKENNITLPPVPPPVANYVDSVQVGKLVFLAGNTAGAEWKYKGKVGKDITEQEGYETARQVGLIMLAKVRGALSSLDRVKRVVKVLGMVNSAEGFGGQPRVINGFSDLMVEVFGEAIGKHARSAVGMAALPGNAAVEVEMIVEVE
jgi:enamine deaminase RidA (YjgF/YER057c/UK114 family)